MIDYVPTENAVNEELETLLGVEWEVTIGILWYKVVKNSDLISNNT